MPGKSKSTSSVSSVGVDSAESIEGRLRIYPVSIVEVIAACESSGMLERVNGDIEVLVWQGAGKDT